jgi:hypothetical protein
MSWLAATLLAGCAIPIIGAFPRDTSASQTTSREPSPVMTESWSKAIGPIPEAAETKPAVCYAALERRGVRFERLPRSGLNGIKMPIRLLSKLGGIDVVPSGSQRHSVLDCRLALALLSWAPSMRKAGVVRLEHLSIYRPGAHIRGGPRISGHAYALAIDAARFHMRDGRVLDVLNDWEDRDRGDAPCLVRSKESRDARLIRRVVCDAVAHDLFQVVLTPHYDHAHRNHIHMELKPDVEWTFVR